MVSLKKSDCTYDSNKWCLRGEKEKKNPCKGASGCSCSCRAGTYRSSTTLSYYSSSSSPAGEGGPPLPQPYEYHNFLLLLLLLSPTLPVRLLLYVCVRRERGIQNLCLPFFYSAPQQQHQQQQPQSQPQGEARRKPGGRSWSHTHGRAQQSICIHLSSLTSSSYSMYCRCSAPLLSSPSPSYNFITPILL